MIKLYICCLVLIIGSVEVGPDIDMKFHQEVMEIVSYDTAVIVHISKKLVKGQLWAEATQVTIWGHMKVLLDM